MITPAQEGRKQTRRQHGDKIDRFPTAATADRSANEKAQATPHPTAEEPSDTCENGTDKVQESPGLGRPWTDAHASSLRIHKTKCASANRRRQAFARGRCAECRNSPRLRQQCCTRAFEGRYFRPQPRTSWRGAPFSSGWIVVSSSFVRAARRYV